MPIEPTSPKLPGGNEPQRTEPKSSASAANPEQTRKDNRSGLKRPIEFQAASRPKELAIAKWASGMTWSVDELTVEEARDEILRLGVEASSIGFSAPSFKALENPHAFDYSPWMPITSMPSKTIRGLPQPTNYRSNITQYFSELKEQASDEDRFIVGKTNPPMSPPVSPVKGSFSGTVYTIIKA